MASQVEICNIALIQLGEDPISAITEDTKPARLLNQVWGSIRDEVLRAHPWNFAMRRASLALLGTAPVWGYSLQYMLPVDCLRVWRMEYLDVDFKVEGRYLLTDESEANVLYISRITDPAQFDTLFVTALAARLAAYLAYPLTANATLAANMMDIYKQQISMARSADAQEGKPDEFEVTTWTDARE